jgi:hypothetical protein
MRACRPETRERRAEAYLGEGATCGNEAIPARRADIASQKRIPFGAADHAGIKCVIRF